MFDGSTNDPVVFPSGTSIKDLENQVLMGVTSTILTNTSTNGGTNFTAQLTGSGGQPPYTWTLAPGSAPLPAGLSLSPSGLISGTPTDTGDFEIIVRMTDLGMRSVDVPVTISIGP
jgi:hypothetical protein